MWGSTCVPMLAVKFCHVSVLLLLIKYLVLALSSLNFISPPSDLVFINVISASFLVLCIVLFHFPITGLVVFFCRVLSIRLFVQLPL